ncbi:hypothetical protein HK405_014123, partial [Cladochytrium tenue]
MTQEELQEAPLLLTPRQLRRGIGSGPAPQSTQGERSDSPRLFGGVTPGYGRVDGTGIFRGGSGNGGVSGVGGSFVRTLRRLFRSKAHNNHNAGGGYGCDDDEGTNATTGQPARPESHATVTETATNESSIPTASSSSVGSPSVSPAPNSAASEDSDRRAATPVSVHIGVAGATTASATSSASSSVFAEANAAMTMSSASALGELASSEGTATLGPRLDNARPPSTSPPISPTIGKGTKVFDRMFPFLRQSGSGSSSSTAARSSATLPAGGAAAAARSIRNRIALAERRDADAAAASARIRPTPTAFRRATQTNSLEFSASTTAPASTAGPGLPRPASQKLTTLTPYNAAKPAAPPPTPLAAVPDLLPCAPVAVRRAAATPTLWRLRGTGRRLFFYRVSPTLASIARTDAYVLEAPRTLAAAAGMPSTGVPSMHRASMPALGAGGALDAAERAATLYVFCGRGAGPVKHARAREFALRVRDRDWNRRADVVEFDEGGMKVPAFLDFLRLLGADPEAAVWDIATAPFLPQQQQLGDAGQDGDEAVFERAMDASYALFRWDPVSTTFLTVAASARALSVQLLDASSAFILACAADCIYTWSGRLCRPEDKRRVAEFAKEIASAYDGVSVVAERDVGESALFVERFGDWADGLSLHVRAAANVAVPDRSRFVYDRGGFQAVSDTIDVTKMFNPPPPPASWTRDADGNQLLGPGLASGSVAPPVAEDAGAIGIDAFVACGPDLKPLPSQALGVLHSADCYVFVYRYRVAQAVPADLAALRRAPTPTESEREACIVYHWIGDDSKPTEQGTVAHAAVDLGKKFNGRPARVSQGHEPDHFRAAIGRTAATASALPSGVSSPVTSPQRGFFPPQASADAALPSSSPPLAPLPQPPQRRPHRRSFPGPASPPGSPVPPASSAASATSGGVLLLAPPQAAPPVVVVRRGASPYSSAAVTSSAATAAAPALFHVFGAAPAAVRASEAPCRAVSLSGGACFVARLKDRAYVWVGRGAFEFERDAAVAVAFRLADGDAVIEIRENAEPRVFWQKLQASGGGGGGRAPAGVVGDWASAAASPLLTPSALASSMEKSAWDC